MHYCFVDHEAVLAFVYIEQFLLSSIKICLTFLHLCNATIQVDIFFFLIPQSMYSTMTEVYGIPEWGCYVIFAVVTLLFGFLVGLVSCYFGRMFDKKICLHVTFSFLQIIP